jgi:hypothetical protein
MYIYALPHTLCLQLSIDYPADRPKLEEMVSSKCVCVCMCVRVCEKQYLLVYGVYTRSLYDISIDMRVSTTELG